MKNILHSPDFFLSANTSEGFFSVFNYLYFPKEGWFCHILKGGPGTGKSTLMKKIYEKASEKGVKSELIHCSSDPDSLDAIIFPDLKISIADGTAPHTLDPIYPGISDSIINLGECWNNKKLFKSGKKIMDLDSENIKYHKKAQKYLEAYGKTNQTIKNIICETIDYTYLSTFCTRLCKKLFNKKSKSTTSLGKEQKRFISSITPKGYVFFQQTLTSLSKNIYMIEDEYGIAGSYILKNIKEKALNSGHNVIACPSPFAPLENLEALLIPELNLSFVVKNKEKSFDSLEFNKKIKTKRFLKLEIISSHKNLLSFNFKLRNELLSEAIKNLNCALKIHNKIEEFYYENMNYSKINRITDKLISDIL